MPDETPADRTEGIDPYTILAQLPNAPTKEQVESIKLQAPNGRVRFYCPDGRRAYLLRGLNGLEWERIQKNILPNLEEDKKQEEFVQQVDLLGCFYASTSKTGRFVAEELKTSGAGLPATLFTIVSALSDFQDPVQIEALSADL
jgi:hypothetical protein